MSGVKPPKKISSLPAADRWTREQFCKFVGRSKRTVQRWERLNIAPARFRCGTLIMYRRDAVLEWLREKENKQR